VNARIAALAAGTLAALAARWFATRQSGLTYTRANRTKYISFNIVLFYLFLGLTIVVCVALKPD
jgi:hypothetical protein